MNLSNSDALSSAYKNYSKASVLYKTRDFLSGRRPRLFVLDSQLLHYYINPDDPAPKRTIFLLGCTISRTAEEDGEGGKTFYPFVVSHQKSAKEYHLAALSSEVREEWVAKLEEASRMGVKSPRMEKEEVVEQQQQQIEDNSDVSSVSSINNGASIVNNGSTTTTPFMHNVPHRYHAKLQTAIASVLNLVNSTGWQPLFEKKGIFAQTKPGKLVTVRGDGIMKQHPMHVFSVLNDIKYKQQFDLQLEVGRRVESYNAHTGCDYLHFKPVWPTSTRDFCNLSTWKVMENGGEKCIVISAFEAFEVPNTKGFVRGECVVAGWVIRPFVDGETGNIWSRVTTVVSTDLKGSLPGSIVSQVTSQQALFPVIISKFMDRMEPPLATHLKEYKIDDITNEALIKDVIEKRNGGEGDKKSIGNGSAPPSPSAPPPAAAHPSPTTPPLARKKTSSNASSIDSATKKISFTVDEKQSSSSNGHAKNGGSNSNNNNGVIVPTSPVLTLSKPSLFFSSFALYLPVISWAVSKYVGQARRSE